MSEQKKINYLSNKEFLKEIIASKKKGKINNQLATMFMLLAKRYASKPNFTLYTYNEDMQSQALADLCLSWNKFDETKYDNPFAFYTQCIHNTFIQMLNKEQQQRKIKDAIRVECGLNPSDSYSEEIGIAIHEKLEQVVSEPKK